MAKLIRSDLPTGGCVWTSPDTNTQVMWLGRGAGLFLVLGGVTTPGASMTRIEHPSADDQYLSRKDASAAVARFFDASAKA